VTPTATRAPRPRVVLLSLAGAGDSLVDQYLERGVMPNLAALAERGAQAEYVLPIDPPTTLTAHASMASGAYPNRTSQVGERFHLPESRVYAAVESPNQILTPVEPLWRTAMRHGLTTATLFWPGAGIEGESLLADLTVTRGAAELDPALHVLTTTPAADWLGAPQSYSPLLEAQLAIRARDGPVVMELAVLAVDGTDDQQENYDTVYVADSRAIADDSIGLQIGEWAAFDAAPRLYGRGQIKLVTVTAERIEFYRTAMWYTRAEPAELLRDINNRFGFCPPPADDEALERGWITPEEYWQMSQHQNRWLNDVLGHVVDAYRPDLTLACLRVTEEMGRQFLISEGVQLEHDPEKATRYAGLLERAYALADDFLGSLLGHVVLGRDAVLVVSGHGLAPAHTEVRLNALLSDAGLLRLAQGGGEPVDIARSKVFAIASGGAAHIYVNLEGREDGGIVPRNEYAAVRSQTIDRLRSTTGPDGDPVFSRVLLREDCGALGLDSFASGDVFVQAWPGYVLSDAVDSSEEFSVPKMSASAGHDASQRPMHAILVAAGFGIQQGIKLPTVRLIDIAPTVAELLGVQHTDHVDGRVLGEMLRRRQ
jgi:predicted AlkP superfamily phosphohydrolase/phosphomutase